MQVILTRDKCIEVLKGDTSMPTHLTQVEKIEMTIRPKVERETIKEKIATLMWEKLHYV